MKIVLRLFVMDLGIAFGAGLCEPRIALTDRMVRLVNTPDSPASRAAAVQWANLDYGRRALVLAAWLAALKAFATT